MMTTFGIGASAVTVVSGSFDFHCPVCRKVTFAVWYKLMLGWRGILELALKFVWLVPQQG